MSPRRKPLRRMSLRRRKDDTEASETDVPGTEEDRDGCPRDGRCVFLNIVEGLIGCYCLISFEWCVYGYSDAGVWLMTAVWCVWVWVWVGCWVGVHGFVWWRREW